MKKLITLSLSFFLTLNVFSQDNLTAIREVFAKGQDDQKTAETLYKSLSERKTLSPVMVAYEGASAALLAKHSMNPMNKLKYLRICQAKIDSAVGLDPDHFEIRMLRFAIEVKTPGVFLENDHIAEDSKILVDKLLREDWPVNDFHAKVAAKVVKYGNQEAATMERLGEKYNLASTAYDE